MERYVNQTRREMDESYSAAVTCQDLKTYTEDAARRL
jgi:hypothetical protein